MSKKRTNRARVAARGTAADPARVALAGGERLGEDVKLKGVMPETMAESISRSAGVAAFSFKSAFLIAGAVLLGSIVIPYLASLAGMPVDIAVMGALPPLLAAALATSRCFIDADHGFGRMFAIIFGVTYAAALLVCWILLYQGLLLF